MTAAFSDTERAAIDLLADQLIPRHPDHLSASEAGVGTTLLDKAATVVPERLDLVADVLGQFPVADADDAVAAIAALRDTEPERFDQFAEIVAGLYFMSADVRRRFGYAGQEPEPAKAEMVDFADILMPVLEIGREPRIAAGDGPTE